MNKSMQRSSSDVSSVFLQVLKVNQVSQCLSVFSSSLWMASLTLSLSVVFEKNQTFVILSKRVRSLLDRNVKFIQMIFLIDPELQQRQLQVVSDSWLLRCQFSGLMVSMTTGR